MQRTFIAIIALVLVGGGIYYMTQSSGSAAPQEAVIPTPSDTTTQGEAMGAQPTGTSTTAAPASGLTAADVAKHASQSDCWTIVSGKVYDVTSVIASHPGGPERIIAVCGKDGTTAFQAMNRMAEGNAMKQMASLYKGDLTQ
jgi:hypothetical protein